MNPSKYHQNNGYPDQWTGQYSQQYPSSSSYPAGHSVSYDNTGAGDLAYQNQFGVSPQNYHAHSHSVHRSNYPTVNTSMVPRQSQHNYQPQGYSQPLNHQQSHSSHSSSQPISTSYGAPYAVAQGHSPTYSTSQSRPRSHSHAIPPYAPSQPVYHQSSQYPSQIPLSSDSPYDYPASPNRPFSCDLCALSFNRQHDLKRHRETHNGDKPYPCNGGCGKTFTRKDALKRHQIVKSCGRVDESWP